MGAGIAMFLNQPVDPDTGEGDRKPLPYDASALQGFVFEIAGATLPAPKALRFTVEADTGEFCNLPTLKIVAGTNRFLFSQLVDSCFRLTDDPPNPSAESAQSKLLKLSWHVVTNTESTVPFDFCVSNVRALLKK